MLNPSATTDPAPRVSGAFAVAAIVLATLLAHHGSLPVPFIFDDTAGIVDNPSIRRLWRLGDVLSPPRDGSGVTGRPIVNASLAINYAISGLDPRGYHVTNVLLHALASVTLFAVVRATLRRPRTEPRLAAAATPLAAAVGLLWGVHPLQTESVTCVVQRTELLVGVFYLLTLFFFTRAIAGRQPGISFALSVAACAIGMGSKEVMVSAPLMVLLYDRTFVAGTFGEAWRLRRGYYLALASTWLLLGFFVLAMGGSRGAAAGFGLGMTPWSYALKQCEAILRYIGLSLWPYPLIVDYGSDVITRLQDTLPELIAVGLAFAGAVAALRRRPALGFLGMWFFAILAPSSSIVPLVTQTMAEHRMYLPLAAVAVLLVTGGHRVAGQRVFPAAAVAIVACGLLTTRRNLVYQDDILLWSSTVAHRPYNAQNARARLELANALLRHERFDPAIQEFRRIVEIRPHYIEAHNNLAAALLKAGRPAEALAQFQRTLAMNPQPIMHFGAGMAAVALQRLEEGLAHYDAALRLKPDYVQALNTRGNLHAQMGNEQLALADYLAALQLKPEYVDAHVNAATSLLALGRPEEALPHCQAATELEPANPLAHLKTGDVALALSRAAVAVEHYQAAVRLDPKLGYAQYGLARSLAALGRVPEAVAAFERTLQLAPDSPAVQYELAAFLEQAGQPEQALGHYQAVLRLQPNHPDAAARLRALSPLPPQGGPFPGGR